MPWFIHGVPPFPPLGMGLDCAEGGFDGVSGSRISLLSSHYPPVQAHDRRIIEPGPAAHTQSDSELPRATQREGDRQRQARDREAETDPIRERTEAAAAPRAAGGQAVTPAPRGGPQVCCGGTPRPTPPTRRCVPSRRGAARGGGGRGIRRRKGGKFDSAVGNF